MLIPERLHFKNKREPFSVTIAGQTIYILTSAKDVATAWKHAPAVSMDPISDEMYTRLGISPKSKKALFDHHPGASYNAGNGRPVSPTDMIIMLHQQQLHTGPRLDRLVREKVIAGILERLDFGRNPSRDAILAKTDTAYTVSLLKLCVDVFIGGTTEIFLGKTIWVVQPELLKWFMDWEHTNWKFLFQLPAILSRDMVAARGELVTTFTGYCQLPEGQRGDRSFFVKELEKMLREVGLSDEDMGNVMMLHYWA
jgi:cholesterol 7alpha-monooxygenase